MNYVISVLFITFQKDGSHLYEINKIKENQSPIP